MTTTPDTPEPIRLAFMYVRNAGRSQMATAFAERERAQRDLEATVEIVTGGTHPADRVHEEVITVMREEGIDLTGRTPRKITIQELNTCDVVATMGCSTLDISDVEDAVDIREWDLPDPAGQDPEQVHATVTRSTTACVHYLRRSVIGDRHMDTNALPTPNEYRHPPPVVWALLFTTTWVLGMMAVLLFSGAAVGSALGQALPSGVALGVLAYVLRRRNE
jgi:arsenate reductase